MDAKKKYALMGYLYHLKGCVTLTLKASLKKCATSFVLIFGK